MPEDLCVQLVPLFQGLDLAKQKQIEQLVHDYHVKAHELIVQPNDPNRLLIVAHGLARLYHLDSNGNEHITRILKAGDYVGETWLLGVNNPNCFVETDTESDICLLNQTDFFKLLKNDVEIATNLLEGQAKRIATLQQQNYLLSINNISKRIRVYLSQLQEQQDRQQIKLPLALKDIASYLGTTPETLSRNLTALEKNGYIKYHLRDIQILKSLN